MYIGASKVTKLKTLLVLAFLAHIPSLPFIHLDRSGTNHRPFEGEKNPTMLHSNTSNAWKSL